MKLEENLKAEKYFKSFRNFSKLYRGGLKKD
jgi:hypothetical protein